MHDKTLAIVPAQSRLPPSLVLFPLLLLCAQSRASDDTEAVARQIQEADYARARSGAQELVAKQPKNGKAMILCGIAELGLGDAKSALPLLETGLRLSPGDRDGLRALALAQRQLGVGSAAEKAYEGWAEAFPEDQEAQLGLGAILASEGRDEEAAHVFSRAMRLNPRNPRARFYTALSYLDDPRLSSAAHKVLKAAMEASKGEAKAAFKEGQKLAKAGKTLAAMKSWDEALSLCPDDKEILRARQRLKQKLEARARASILAGQEREEAEDYEKARLAYQSALAQDPDSDEAAKRLVDLESARRRSAEKHLRKGQSFSLKGRLQDAVAEYRLSLSFDPSLQTRRALDKVLGDIQTENARLLRTAALEAAAGRNSRARELFVQALALEPCLPLSDSSGTSRPLPLPARARHQESYLDGLSAYVAGDLEKALVIWQDILKEDPGSRQAHDGVDMAKKELAFLASRGMAKAPEGKIP